MFNREITSIRGVKNKLIRNANELGKHHKNYILLVILAGVLERAHAFFGNEVKTPIVSDETDDVLIPSINTQAIDKIAAIIESVDKDLNIIKQIEKLVSVDPVIKGALKKDLEINEAELVAIFTGEAAEKELTPEQLLQLAELETGIMTDAVNEDALAEGTATSSAAEAGILSTPLMIALGILGIGGAGTGIGLALSGGGGSNSGVKINQAPTAIALSSQTVAENATGAVIGSLTTTDPDTADTHTYTVDDARFEVVAGELKLKDGISLDFETETSVDVTVTSTDDGDLATSQLFTLTVTNVNEAPTAIALSATTIAENAVGAVVGSLTTTDVDALDTHSYTVDDARFEVVAGDLKLKDGVSLDFETETSVPVTVTSTDNGGLSTTQIFTIIITDVAETTLITGTNGTDSYSFPTSLDTFIINALAGNDSISTGKGNDIIRPGEGVDTTNTGDGNDLIVVVGQTAANQYVQSDITNPGGSGVDLSSVLTLDTLNGRAVSEVITGEAIDGGVGTNRLVIYGNVDFTGVTLNNVTQFQVNSTVTIGAQQLNNLPVTLMVGDGDSTLNIFSVDGSAITVDLSNIQFSDFKTLNLGKSVTLIADQADVDSLKYITGSGTLKASVSTGNLNLSNKQISVTVQDKDGVEDAAHGATVTSGETIIGSEVDDRLEGGFDDDVLIGEDGNDVLRGGAGIDVMDGGAGDDIFVVVGDLSGGGKVDSVEDTFALAQPLTELNGQNLNEDADGAKEIIRGGEGDDTLYVYGTADLSNYDITGIEHIEIRSDVIFESNFLTAVSDITGDGSSTIRIVLKNGAPPQSIDLTKLNLTGIGHIEVGDNVTLNIDSLDQLGGARILTGAGAINVTSGSISLPTNYTVTKSLTITNLDTNSSAKGSAQVLDNVTKATGGALSEGTDGDDFMQGTAAADTFDPKKGNDVLLGEDGNDIFKISGSGNKIILDKAGEDTLDLSTSTTGYVLDLTDGGSNSDTTITLGAANGAAQNRTNLMLIFDVSGSMGFGTLLADAKQAAIDLLNAYDSQGNVAVRVIAFQSSARSSFNGVDEWMTIDSAKSIVNGFSASGGTNYSSAMNVAQQAFNKGKGNVYLANGNNVSFFLSDGDPNTSVYYKENSWENFLIENDITSHAIGFGGLNSTYELEPIAFDGTKVDLPTDNHAAGEIPAVIEVDTSNLGKALIENLDFIENLIGTPFDDRLEGNSLSNKIAGGDGNDTLMGGKGDDTIEGGYGWDTVVYSGVFSEYSIVENENGWTVSDSIGNRDGVDNIAIDVDVLKFTDRIFNLRPTATETFKAEGNDGLGSTGIFNTGMIRVMADFSKAVYSIQAWENLLINEEKSYSDEALANLIDLGTEGQEWVGIDLSPTLVSPANNIASNSFITVTNQMLNGFYTNGNAAALVARNADTLVVSFRGTNDNNQDDSPDMFDWFDKSTHYDFFDPLVENIESYIQEQNIQQVYVTGHSLGGAMALKFMDDHKDGMFGANYDAITFAAPPYGFLIEDDPQRILQFEIDYDPVPDVPGNQPGRTIHFGGNQTNSLLDSANHSMDFYRQITDSIDSESWQRILSEPGDLTVALGAEYLLDDFIVDGRLSGLNLPINDGSDIIQSGSHYILFGGIGNDELSGGTVGNLLLGGPDDDTLIGGFGNNVLTGGTGKDKFVLGKYLFIDTITDFVSGDDKLVFSVNAFNAFKNLSPGSIDINRLIVSSDPTPISEDDWVFLFDTDTSTLSFDEDGADSGLLESDNAPHDIAVLTGIQDLSHTDFLLV